MLNLILDSEILVPVYREFETFWLGVIFYKVKTTAYKC